MEFLQPLQPVSMAMAILILFMLWILCSWWLLPTRQYKILQRSGFRGPSPLFPLGNISEMRTKKSRPSFESSTSLHDIHSSVFPYFSQWQKSFGKPLSFHEQTSLTLDYSQVGIP